jgi:hypothetical protein
MSNAVQNNIQARASYSVIVESSGNLVLLCEKGPGFLLSLLSEFSTTTRSK